MLFRTACAYVEPGRVSIDMKANISRILIAGSLALLLTACDSAPAPGQEQRPPPEVTVVTARAGSVPRTREAVGLLASTRIAQVRARVAGIVLKRVYTEGTDVKEGDILFQIDPAPFKADLEAEEAVLARARADAANAARIAKRYQELAAKGLLATQDRDTAMANMRSTAAAVEEARANAARVRLDLEYATVRAPISGRAGRALVTEGALVGQDDATLLTTVEQIDPIYANFSLPVNELNGLRRNAAGDAVGASFNDRAVEVVLPDGSVYPERGTLDFSDLAVDSNTGAVSLRAVLPNHEQRLLPGMYVTLRLNMGSADQAFLLPQPTVQRDANGAYVLVVGSGGKVDQRRVETLGMTQSGWIVTGALTAGEQVIMEGLQHVRPGQKARVVTARAGAGGRAEGGSRSASSE